MIKSNELRIGNWLIDGNGGYYQVEIADLALLSSRPDTKECSPIPLSAEILEKAGFKKYASDELQLEYENDYWICKHPSGMGVYLAYDVEEYVEVPLLHVQHLHQLQNLVHALTGEELTVTL